MRNMSKTKSTKQHYLMQKVLVSFVGRVGSNY